MPPINIILFFVIVFQYITVFSQDNKGIQFDVSFVENDPYDRRLVITSLLPYTSMPYAFGGGVFAYRKPTSDFIIGVKIDAHYHTRKEWLSD